MIRSKHTVDDGPALDPAVAAELAALDAALRGDTIEDDGLAQLVRDVQAQAPAMPGDLRKRLRHEVSEGFPRGTRGRLRVAGDGVPRRPRGRSLLALSSGLSAVAVVVLVVAVGRPSGVDDAKRGANLSDLVQNSAAVVPGGEDLDKTSGGIVNQDQLTNAFDRKTRRQLEDITGSSSSAASSGDASVSTEQGNAYKRPAGPSSSASAAAAPPQVDTFSRSARSPTSKLSPSVDNLSATRKVERSVDMAVRVKSGELSDAAAKVGQIARASGGYVSDSRVSLRTRGAGSASYALRVATAKLDSAVGQLSALGTVTHQDQDSADITSSFDSAQGRLDDANRVRAALLRALAKATTSGQISSLRSRIADNRKTRASLDSQLSALKRRADLTTITLTLSAPTSGAAAATDDDGSWSLGDAARDTVHILGTVTGVLLVAAGAALPFAILALIAWPVYRVTRRRRREAALGS